MVLRIKIYLQLIIYNILAYANSGPCAFTHVCRHANPVTRLPYDISRNMFEKCPLKATSHSPKRVEVVEGGQKG